VKLARIGLALAMVGGLALAAGNPLGCEGGTVEENGWGDGGPPPDPCKEGGDLDGDGYGTGCKVGNDCDDHDPAVHPGAREICDGKDNNCNGKVDEGVKNPCGTCDPGCASVGKGAKFPLDSSQDPDVKDARGVENRKGKGNDWDLVLGTSKVNFNYMWIANTYDWGGKGTCGKGQTSNPACRGTISKVDTVKMKEVARYFTVTCKSRPGASGCVDVNGKPIVLNHNHTPSRTAVDYNFDVWVANRSVHGGQPSATKIANDPLDCVDRNKNGKIDTSKDRNGDGHITVDCNGDGKADGYGTRCTGKYAGMQPEFLGDDDECILMTVNYGDPGDVGRSICLDMGKGMVGASNAWVGTFYRPERGRGSNKFFKINGSTGKIEAEVTLPGKHHSYGCMADAHNIIWSTDIYGSLTYFKGISPYSVGAFLQAPWVPKKGKTYHHYGISIDGHGWIWLGGYHSYWVLRYKPNRASFSSLARGTWTRIDVTDGFVTRGIAADKRGFVWVAIQDGGYILRIAQNIPDGVHNRAGSKNIWKLKADTVIGVGIDFAGNVWGVGHKNHIASRLDVDAKGNVKDPQSGLKHYVVIGKNPYTYSDFTGYGLMNFVRPSGRYIYQFHPCPRNTTAQWKQIGWNATTPAGTSITVRARSGDIQTNFGSWTRGFTSSPAVIGPGSSDPVKPNPSNYLQVEITLQSRKSGTTPVLHDLGVAYTCVNTPN